MMTTTDRPPVRRRNRRPALPAISEIERLINQSRGIRIALSPFTNNELCGPISKEAITSLQEASAKLERLAELTAALGSRRRRRTTTVFLDELLVSLGFLFWIKR
jgi:hypothetical protein